jgi:hypothetical protein
MRKYIIALTIAALPFSSCFASHWVHTYTRSNGTTVNGHMSDDPGEGAYGHWHHNEYYPNNGVSSNNNAQEGSGYNNSLSNDGMNNNQENSSNPYGQ